MKATDLMIGDWVLDGTQIAQITSITCGGVIETTAHEISNIEVIEPIPLTKDILNQNFDFHTIPSDGIHSKDEFWLLMEKPKRVWLHQYATSVFVQIDTKDEYDCECRLLQIKVLHVHELQHALKLCGMEKQINL